MTTIKQRSGGVKNAIITTTAPFTINNANNPIQRRTANDDNTITNTTTTTTTTISSSTSLNIDKKYEKKKRKKMKCFIFLRHRPSLSSIITMILLLMILLFLGLSINNNSSGSDDSTIVSSFNILRRWYIPRGKVENYDNGANRVTVSHNSDYNILVRLDDARFESSETTSTPSRIVSPGPHAIKLTTTCVTDTRWAIRIVGDALLYVTLRETQNDNPSSSTPTMLSYEGTFSLPIPGTFTLEIYRSGSDDCRDTNSDGSPFIIDTIPFTVKDDPVSQRRRRQPNQPGGPYLWNRQSLFAPAHWLSIDYINRRYPDTTISDLKRVSPGGYIWMDPTTPRRPITVLDERIILEGTVKHNTTGAGFYSFGDLSNYELVCFFGGRTAADAWAAFRSLRPRLFPHQRPFKFHLYESTNMTSPNQDWDEGKEKGLRKCKHLLVFTDDWNYGGGDGVASEDYRTRMTIFVNHLLKLLPDDTFPIWIFTMMESPLKPTHCRRDRDNAKTWPKSTEHPCNEILRELFADDDGNDNASLTFPERVRLLDNTDLSTARLLSSNNNTTADLDINNIREILLFNIALRIFVVVGKQVEVWRSSGQVGREAGLFRNGVKQWEHELIPYKWN